MGSRAALLFLIGVVCGEVLACGGGGDSGTAPHLSQSPPQTVTKVVDVGASIIVAASTMVKVRVTDIFGNPVSGTSVVFAVTSGNGSVTPASAATDATGMASATWTVGTRSNTSTGLIATAGTAQVTYNCLPVAGPTAADAMSTPYMGGTVGESLSFSLAAQDTYGNPAMITTASFVSRNSTVLTLQGANTSTGAWFNAAALGQTYVVGSASGFFDSTLVAVFSPAGVLVSAPAPRFDLKTDTSFTTRVQLNTGPSTEGVGSVTVAVTWDPAVLTYVNDVGDAYSPATVINPYQRGKRLADDCCRGIDIDCIGRHLTPRYLLHRCIDSGTKGCHHGFGIRYLGQ